MQTALKKSWTQIWGGSGSEDANAIAIDSSGNLYVAGEFSGIVDFDPTHADPPHTSNGIQDAFLTKWDANGNFLWARTWGGAGRDVAYSVAVDSSGNAYVTGPYRNTVDFDPGPGVTSYTSNAGASNNVYFSKFDTNGTFKWVRTWGPSNGGAEGYSIAIDPSDNIFLVGDFNIGTPGGTCDFNPWGGHDLRTSHGFYDGFLTRFDPNGTFQWAKTWGGWGYDDTTGVAVDGSNGVYVTGMYGSTDINFDPAGGDGGKNHPAHDNSFLYVDVYLTKFTPAGAFQWVRTWGGAGTTEAGQKILVDHAHNIYVAGRFECSNCNFDGTGMTQDIHSTNGGLGDLPNQTDFDAFVSKYDASGAFLWARTWGGAHWDSAQGIAVDDANNLYVTGVFNQIVCDPAYPTVPPACPASLASTVDFDPGPGTALVTSNLYSDVFLSKFDPRGNFLWVKTWGANGADGGNGVAFNTAGDLYVIGWFEDSVDFVPGPDVDVHTSHGLEDAFLSKFAAIDLPFSIFLPGVRAQ